VVGGILLLLGLLLMWLNRGGAGPSITWRGITLAMPSGGFGVVILGAVMMVAAPMVERYAAPPEFHVAGRIQIHEGKSVRGIQNVIVGIIPMRSHATSTSNDGSFEFRFPRGEDGQQYQVFAYLSHPNQSLALSTLGRVHFDSSGRGVFDHVFDRSGGK
jgi:hypothetical protein